MAAGNLLSIDDQWRKLELVVETARKVWGGCSARLQAGIFGSRADARLKAALSENLTRPARHCDARRRPRRLQRAQEIEQVLLLALRQAVKDSDDAVGFRALAGVGFDGLEQVGSSSVVQEEDSLAESPQGRGAEFVRACGALRNSVGQSRPMLCTSKSENKFAWTLLSAGT